MDFTLSRYRSLLTSLKQAGYTFQPYAEYLASPAEKVVILRHDVDKRPHNSLVTAQIENELGIRGTYYFRIVKSSYNEEIIKQIHHLGHEIGYHYEDLSLITKTYRTPNTEHRLPNTILEIAILSFTRNLDRLRKLAPITTICMHGSPLSRYDNRLIWDHYNYRDYGIIGEPYFHTDFSKVLYLTDTGRTWNNAGISVRDKPNTEYRSPITHTFSTTTHIITAALSGYLPPHIMLTVHPQRWTSSPLAWVSELIIQNLKNMVKVVLIHSGRR